ncbi:MAG: FAD binding domain-containing protein, partial [Acidimicrobiia bacterium]
MRTDLPTTLDHALDLYADDPDATLLAGGTDLMVEVNFSQLRPSHMIALRRIEELAFWEDARIGAGVTYRRMERGPIRALAELSRTVGSPQIRNAGTIGGNLGTCSPAGDVLPFLSALDAEVELASAPSNRRRVPFSEFMVGPKQNSAAPGEVIVAALLPADIPERQAFGKIGVRN